ncbi:MAG: hypothetical protein AAGI53_09645 [Planctomycetota bacterium]
MTTFTAAGAAAALVLSTAALAAPTVFSGLDAAAMPGSSTPNSNQAQASFLEATGASIVVDYESLATIRSSTLSVAPGVSVEGSFDFLHVENRFSDAFNGFATSGSQYLWANSAGAGQSRSFTFEFDEAINAFGTFVTGLGTAGGSVITVTYEDGSVHTMHVNGSTAGGKLFFGFHDEDASITSLTFTQDNSADAFAFDDTLLALATTAVPLPTASGLGLAGLAFIANRRRR